MSSLQLNLSSLPLIDPRGDLSSVQVLVIYGVGEGSVSPFFKKWLEGDPLRHLVFIEDDEDLFLQMKGSDCLANPQVRLYFYRPGNLEFFKEIAWEFVFLTFSYAISPEKGEGAETLFTQLFHYHEGVHALASDSQDLGRAVLNNVRLNQAKLPCSILAESLKNSCEGIPAIICGAGPSLDTALQELVVGGDRALILAGGSAVTALSLMGIRPHFCAHFDPSPPRDRFLQQDVAEIPHFYQSRFDATLLSSVHSPLLWVAESGSYPIETWIRKQYGIESSPFDGGWTVANLCTAIAVHLGCNPIIFVGMEFSCHQDQIYAGGMPGKEHAEDPFIKVSEEGLYSKRDWLLSVDWLGELVKKEGSIRFLNATLGGLEIPGAPRVCLDEVVQTLPLAYDLTGWIHALVETAERLGATSEDVGSVDRELKQSFNKCSACCDELLLLWEKAYPQSPVERGQYALIQSDLEEEVIYLYFLEPLWGIWKQPILRGPCHPLEQQIHRLLFFKRAIEANA